MYRGLAKYCPAFYVNQLHVDEISSRSSAYIKANINASNMTTTSRGRKFTYNIINTQLWERESARALQTICMVGFLQRLSTIDEVTKYRGIPISRYF